LLALVLVLFSLPSGAFGAELLLSDDGADFEQEVARDCRMLEPDCPVPQTIKTKIHACDVEMASQGCQDLKKSDPKAPLKNCSVEATCVPPWRNATDVLYGCTMGFAGVMWDTVVGVKDMFGQALERIEHDARYNNPYVFEACTKAEKDGKADVVRRCKARLLEEFPDLIIANFGHLDQLSYKDVDAKVHAKLREIETNRKSLASVLKNPEKMKKLVEEAKKYLEKQGYKLACYDHRAGSELMCYGIFSVVDPTVAVTYVAKIAGIPKLTKTAEVLKATNAERKVGDVGITGAAKDAELARLVAREPRLKAIFDTALKDPNIRNSEAFENLVNDLRARGEKCGY
jgi:hypothetical protein